jgi:hypothetical protein
MSEARFEMSGPKSGFAESRRGKIRSRSEICAPFAAKRETPEPYIPGTEREFVRGSPFQEIQRLAAALNGILDGEMHQDNPRPVPGELMRGLTTAQIQHTL